MVGVTFVCLGNICRSPMAESVFTRMVKERGLEGKIFVSSAAARTDAIGCQPHRGTRDKLREKGVPLVPHTAVLLTREDGERYDYIVCMDEGNVRDVKGILDETAWEKVRLLLSFAGSGRSVADPWYTGDFERTYEDVTLGCNALLDEIEARV